MKSIINNLTEPRFRKLVVDLSQASSKALEAEIIMRHNELEMSEQERTTYADNVEVDINNALKAIDENITELKSAKRVRKRDLQDNAFAYSYA